MGTQDINFMADRLRKMATDGDGYFAQDDIRRLFAAADSMAEAADEIARLRAEVERLRETLAWYGEQARLARLIHSEGDKGRSALAADGGDRARKALEGGE